MTTFTGSIHRDNWKAFFDIVAPAAPRPGLPRRRTSSASRTPSRTPSRRTCAPTTRRSSARSGSRRTLFAGTPYGHPVLGTVAGIQSITLEDVRGLRPDGLHARGADRRRRRRRARRRCSRACARSSRKLPAGPALAAPAGRRRAQAPRGLQVEIIEKDTRATAISLGQPIEVDALLARLRRALGRAHLARRAPLLRFAPLPAHPRDARHELRRLRLHRGVPARHVPVLPGPEPRPGARRSSRSGSGPVVPDNAHMALRIAIAELDKLVAERPLAGGLRDARATT